MNFDKKWILFGVMSILVLILGWMRYNNTKQKPTEEITPEKEG